ncbi:cellulase family glycosylhydrolase [Bailinhaonella thermotolerans]|uniref:Glycoside hydrolase family 5 protein n=1 Tax=Bailinhaonella thermotolerans TaxID=1070861 RepID=A0A3A4AX22_9ACTN|nr:cellulase family glycosylhydrolase [Bailinhaonella thermotolerans]RJL30467.1 glycoside hydrolase family 5 protein [Bailinhaonella thermotolerans]
MRLRRTFVTGLALAGALAVPLSGAAVADPGAPPPPDLPRYAEPPAERHRPPVGGQPYITDAQGRTLVLRGMNTADDSKWSEDGMPWISKEDVAREAKLIGSNVVRYLIHWEHIEPQKGKYDDAYLDKVAERLRWYRKNGINVVLDMHQDVYGKAATGNGAPAWATITDGLPIVRRDPWILTYLEPGVVRAFDHLWGATGKHPELMDHYVKAWAHVAKRFGNDPAVIGYDLFNEPFRGSTERAKFEAELLTPAYQRMIDAIRRYDRDNWIFVEGTAEGVNWGDRTHLQPLRGSRLAYAPHLYPLELDSGVPYEGEGKAAIQAAVASWRKNAEQDAARLKMPIWLGEHGFLDADNAGFRAYVADVLNVMNQMGIGGVYWSNNESRTGPWERDKRLNPMGQVLAQPYARAIPGVPAGGSFDAAAKTLTVSWKPTTRAPAEVWLPAALYPNGAKVTAASGKVRTSFDRRTGVLSVWSYGSRAATQTLTIAPR